MRPVNGLMIAHLVTHPYRVMRCFGEVGVTVHVIGNRLSRGLKFSRHCASFTESKLEFDGTFLPEMADEINILIERHGIDLVFPSDHASCRSFHGIKDQLKARSFPGPSLETFDQLNNKWRFFELCKELEILCPSTKLFATKSQLASAAESEISFPAIAKPLALAASQGVFKLERQVGSQHIGGLEQIDYEPILVQDYTKGKDIGASMYCHEGKVVRFIAHSFAKGVFSTFGGFGICDELAKIAARLNLNGVYDFDMRLTDGGRVYFLECNPRFFYNMNLSMLCGMNFVLPGLDETATRGDKFIPDTQTRTSRAFPPVLLQPWKLTKHDWAFLKYTFADPVSYFREVFRIDHDV